MCEHLVSGEARAAAPFRFDVVGSYLRPAALKEAREQFANGQITAQQLREVEDREIIKLIAKQKEVGLQAVTDGEFRRSWWHLDFFWGFDGVQKLQLDKGYVFHGIETRAETARLTGKVSYSSHPFVEDFIFLQANAGQGVIARQTIPAPAQFFKELTRPENRPATDSFYSSLDELIQDIAVAYKGVIKAFYDAGCRNLQLDDCTWGMICDAKVRDSLKEAGEDPDELAELFAKANALAIEDCPSDLIITTHVCRGNYKSTWAGSGGYETVAETLFGIEKYDGYYLEFDTDRAGSFEPLRHANGQQIVLGLLSSKIGDLENKEEIVARIKEATKYVDLNNICLSPQCGFASTEEGNALTEEQQWAKLAFIKEIADEIWK